VIIKAIIIIETGHWWMYKKWNTNGIKLLTTALREDDTSFPAISNMNVEGQPEHFHRQALQSAESAAGSSEGGGAAATCSMSFSSGTIWASHMCLQQEQHNLQQRLQKEQHQRG